MFTNIVLPDGLSSREEDFLRGIIKSTSKNYPIIDGSPGDDLKLKQTWQFANGVHTDSGVRSYFWRNKNRNSNRK
jgi:hypothetical protein